MVKHWPTVAGMDVLDVPLISSVFRFPIIAGN